ncbi:beta-ketoacyl-ACP reductase [Fodinicola feengrottensis]|uniref:3-oxoacyl-[acyl-carrier-protein] reductase MabA n=1 Tax=Fodinicola feengrottensis TaxID=435914 RepID=A0ABP4TNP3_9ACTN|nr:beta-ketoacyl-ACP reductase [Fodinicola feengrottensis]
MATPEQRVALVTGAARGIGAAVARRLASDGAALGVLDLEESTCASTVDAITSAGGKAIALGADVSNGEQITAAVDRLAKEFGSVDILVNNAGVTRDNLLFKMTEQDWDTVVAVHLKGAFLASKAVQKYMVERKYGKIVSMSSVSALGNRGQANYSAVKAGLQGFTRTLAIELGPFGINVNAVAPGFIATDMTDDTARRVGVTPEELQKQAASITPVRRVGQPEDIANTIAFLTSDESSFITGQIIYVDGGRKLT